MITKSIQKPRDGRKIAYKNGNTIDIINVIKAAAGDKRIVEDVRDFVRDNNLQPTIKSLERLWRFVRTEISYVEDGASQDIQYPSALWQNRYGDCKSKTIFIIACLEALREKYGNSVSWIIRFATYDKFSPYVTHVYPVAVVAGKQIIIDSVWTGFNSEKLPKFLTQNVQRMEVATISGIGNTRYYNEMNGIENIDFDELEGVGNLKSKVRDFILKKALKGFLYVFIDAPLKKGSRTERKTLRQRKILNWISKKFNIPYDVLLANARTAIKKQFKQEPEVLIAEFGLQGKTGAVKGIGCVDPISCAALVTAIGTALIPLLIKYQKGKAEADGVEMDKDDFKVNLSEIGSDLQVTVPQLKAMLKDVQSGKKKVFTKNIHK